MIYIGIDPGKKGAWAVLRDGEKPMVYPWDDTFFVSDLHGVMVLARERGDGVMACVEKVGAFRGQGVKSMFNFGKSAGFIEGVLTALGIPYQLVPPNVWKKSFSLIGKDKQASIDTCKRMFPGINLMPSDRCRKDSDGMAEALLMAEFAKRKL